MKTNGKGKYDTACTVARESTAAAAIVLVVFNGNQGSGFSVQAEQPEIIERLPEMLEAVAKQIREDLKATLQ